MSLLDNYEQTNKYTSFIVCIPTAWENNLRSQLPDAALKQYSNGIPRSAPIPTMPVWDGIYNEDVAQLFFLKVVYL